jgi:hypothetical protein
MLFLTAKSMCYLEQTQLPSRITIVASGAMVSSGDEPSFLNLLVGQTYTKFEFEFFAVMSNRSALFSS